MNHYDDDKLLESVLGLLSDDESKKIIAHAHACESCSARLDKMKSEVAVLGGITPKAEAPAFPKKRARIFDYPAILKVAALLMVGFLGGFAASHFMVPQQINVVPAYLESAPPADSLAFSAVSDATALASVP